MVSIFTIAAIKFVYSPDPNINRAMDPRLAAIFREVPPRPDHQPVRKAIALSADRPEVAAALRLFVSMPASTSVLANPVRHHHRVPATGATLELDIRSFTVRGKLFEEDIITRKADAVRVIFVGLFGRMPNDEEANLFQGFLGRSMSDGIGRSLAKTLEFVKTYPQAPPDVVMQHWASLRKAARRIGAIYASRPADELLAEMIDIHLENVGVMAIASFICGKGSAPAMGIVTDPFEFLFHMLLRRAPNADEVRILGQLGTIQVHHGSAGSNMVARYFATLHTRSVSDLFTASQMALDCGRHFGAISDMTDFVHTLLHTTPAKRDDAIRERIMEGNLPTFGHPEIAAAGRENHLEMDPRPALYLAPLFEAIDRGAITVRPEVQERVALVERIYQIALVEGVQKPTGTGRLRLTPNTDFGAWLVQEILGIEEPDRTMLSYSYRGFGWMMDVREQLQQPIIRPVIPPDPAIMPKGEGGNVIPSVITSVHERLRAGNAFTRR
jgi:citrate synthase